MAEETWEEAFAAHARRFRLTRALWRSLPTDPRCKLCAAPFGGVGGMLVKPFGYRPSRKNPNLCDACVEHGPKGGFEIEGGILFADVRGFTGLTERLAPTKVAELANRFYEATTAALLRHDAIVDKLVGDQVMALFWPVIVDGDTCEVMADAAEDLLRSVGYGSGEEPWLEIGIGIAFGNAYVGNVGGGDIQDFTALGDVVNVASRLQSAAAGGQIVMSETVWSHVAARYPDAERVELELKGKSAPVAARVVDLGGPRVAVPDDERPSWVEHVEGRVSRDV